jgi:hypothetical protein
LYKGSHASRQIDLRNIKVAGRDQPKPSAPTIVAFLPFLVTLADVRLSASIRNTGGILLPGANTSLGSHQTPVRRAPAARPSRENTSAVQATPASPEPARRPQPQRNRNCASPSRTPPR